MIWDYKNKLKLHGAITAKLREMKPSKLTSDGKFLTQWNDYLDNLGCRRIERIQKNSWVWKFEDEFAVYNNMSINSPGHVHVSNPFWPGSFHKSDRLIRIPKETAEKILMLGMP
jgi:hypothetical protein